MSLDSPPRERSHGSVLFSRPSHATGVDSRHDAAPSRRPAEEDGEQIKDMLLSEGWCFPFIELGRANEKKLFEFQVRCVGIHVSMYVGCAGTPQMIRP